ncbi:AAA family ATPase, partial [Desulfovibrio sp. OttesenSCG-928-G15]|nr:AAA family ATPase [Desulfovibrio sp. OttesenSCG-928-G15]
MFKDTLRKHLEKTFPHHELARWYDPLELEVDENKQVISVAFPHSFFADWFMATARPKFEEQVCAVSTGMPIIYKNGFTHAPGLQHAHSGVQATTPENRKNGNGRNGKSDGGQYSHGQTAKPSVIPISKTDRQENAHFTLDNFLVNRKNDFPLAAAKESVEKATCPPYTPFVIYGHSGVGKTHLLAAMANAVRTQGLSCLFSDIAFLESASLFKGNFFSLSEQCLFIDDMQRIGSMPELQDAFAALIDAFSSSNKLLALAFDCHPSVCAGLDHKLKSRLTAGLVVEIKRPDLDIRRQYVQLK